MPIVHAQVPVISTQPADVPAAHIGDTVTLSVTANVSSGTLSYQWYQNSQDSNTGGTPIGSATENTYSPPTTAAGTVYYYCVIINSDPTVNGDQTVAIASEVAGVTVLAAATPTPAPTVDIDDNVPVTGESGSYWMIGLLLLALAFGLSKIRGRYTEH